MDHIFGDSSKPQKIGDALLSMYTSAFNAFITDRKLMFADPWVVTTPETYFGMFSGFDPDDPAEIISIEGVDQ